MCDPQKLELKDPSVYLIQIQGMLDENWGEYFGGEFVTSQDADSQNSVTTLRTLPIDQPELVGLVNRLNGLGMRLLSVESLSTENDQKP